MTVDIIKLKAVTAANKANQCETAGLNDYGLGVAPVTVQGLITGIERHRQVNAKGCKPESIISTASADAPALHDKVKPSEGAKFLVSLQRHSSVGIHGNRGVAA